jgi:hypothetical protein
MRKIRLSEKPVQIFGTGCLVASTRWVIGAPPLMPLSVHLCLCMSLFSHQHQHPCNMRPSDNFCICPVECEHSSAVIEPCGLPRDAERMVQARLVASSRGYQSARRGACVTQLLPPLKVCFACTGFPAHVCSALFCWAARHHGQGTLPMRYCSNSFTILLFAAPSTSVNGFQEKKQDGIRNIAIIAHGGFLQVQHLNEYLAAHTARISANI